MNKIKLMYDVAKALQAKNVFIGSLEVEGKKDQVGFFALKNEFEKNLVSGQVKAKVSTSLDLEGKQIKHESTSEFNIQNCCAGRHRHHHRPHHHLRGHFHSNGFNEETGCCGSDESNCCCTGLKGKLSALTYVLGLIDKVEIEEQANNALALTLKIDELPEELMQHMQRRFQHGMAPNESQGQECCSGMHSMMNIEKPVIAINIQLNADKAIEKVVITAEGKQKDNSDQIHDINCKAELNLTW